MIRNVLSAVFLTFAPTLASAQDVAVPISEVDVTVELEAVDANALDLWPQIGPDLEAAISTAAAPFLAPDGLLVTVVLNEVSLGGTPTLPETGEFNRLGGWMYVRDDPAEPPVMTRELIFEADDFVPGGTSEFLIVPDRPDFYTALVNVFAARVVEEIDALQ